METVNCDFCGSNDYKTIIKQRDLIHRTSEELFEIVECQECGLNYTNPRPQIDEIQKYYSEDYAFHSSQSVVKIFFTTFAEIIANMPFSSVFDLVPFIGRRLSQFVKPSIADPVLRYFKTGGRGPFLDLGCGSGAYAHYWGRAGSLLSYRKFCEVYGVETNERARMKISSYNIQIWEHIDQIEKNKKFGIIRMNWSLEHVHRPSKYFLFMKEHLADYGKIIITVPNYDGIIYRLSPKCVELPIHLYHFSPNDIMNYAKRNNLTVTNLKTFSYYQMFVFASKIGLLPKSMLLKDSIKKAKAFKDIFLHLDGAGFGNDMIVEMQHSSFNS